jgi:hypothetical protein
MAVGIVQLVPRISSGCDYCIVAVDGVGKKLSRPPNPPVVRADFKEDVQNSQVATTPTAFLALGRRVLPFL